MFGKVNALHVCVKKVRNNEREWGQIVNVRGKGRDEFHLNQASLPRICQRADGGLVANGDAERS